MTKNYHRVTGKQARRATRKEAERLARREERARGPRVTYHDREQEVLDSIECYVLRVHNGPGLGWTEATVPTLQEAETVVREYTRQRPGKGINVYASATVQGEQRLASIPCRHWFTPVPR